MDAATTYLEEAIRGFRGQKRLAEGALSQINDREFFSQLDREANSVALIIKHMTGNMRSRWTNFLGGDGEKPDRNRDAEFELDPNIDTRDDLMSRWDENWQLVLNTVSSLEPSDLTRSVYIRGQVHTVLQAINRQLTHYAYHVGQIVLLAKHARGAKWKSLSIAKGESKYFTVEAMSDLSRQLGMSERELQALYTPGMSADDWTQVVRRLSEEKNSRR